jgi:hypothetical protein
VNANCLCSAMAEADIYLRGSPGNILVLWLPYRDPMGMYLAGVHLTGVHLMGIHLIGVCFMACTSQACISCVPHKCASHRHTPHWRASHGHAPLDVYLIYKFPFTRRTRVARIPISALRMFKASDYGKILAPSHPTIQACREHLSDFCGEIEESCLLVCHFYLAKERADTYRYKNPIGQVSISWRTRFCLRNAIALPPRRLTLPQNGDMILDWMLK